MANIRGARRLSRAEPRHGLAVCGCPRPAPAEPDNRGAIAHPHCDRPCNVGGIRHCLVGHCRHSRSFPPRAHRIGPSSARMGRLPLALRASPPCALRYAGGAVGTGRLVVPNGDRTRCRSHALASPRGILRLYQFERGGLRYPIPDSPCGRWGPHLGDAPHHRLRCRAHLRMDRPFHSSKSLAERRSGVRAARNRWASAFWYDRVVGPERRVTGERSSPRLISTVLAALTAGYFLGGFIADRTVSAAVLGMIVGVASVYLLALPSFADAILRFVLDTIYNVRLGSLYAALAIMFVLVMLFVINRRFVPIPAFASLSLPAGVRML